MAAKPSSDSMFPVLVAQFPNLKPENHSEEVPLATSVIAPMVGKVLKIEKQAGERVEEDDVVVVLEAMKMEIPVVAPAGGVVKEVKVAPGQAVEAEQELAVIE
jgi:biotin carboxyl carrier protein